jgi:glycerol-3-phosphate dehydrogenase (NAD(P)+)
VEVTTDLIGVEHAGAFKNVIAICAGMVRGLGFSYGAETHLISRMAQEVEAFCIRSFGAARETFSIGSQCWGSDLWMSCTGTTRNRALGELLGQGQSLQEANEQMASQQKTVEGVQTLRALDPILQDYPDELPLIGAAHQVILHNAPPQTLVDALMQNDA